jgi:flavin-dependent dehydrogenase
MKSNFSYKNQQTPVIAIIGGGPAGSATALALMQSLAATQGYQADRCQVHLYDMSSGVDRDPPGNISPAVTPVLKKLCIEDIVNNGDIRFSGRANNAQRSSEPLKSNEFTPISQESDCTLNAEKLDQQLLDRAIEAGVQLHQGWRLIDVKQGNGRTHLDFSFNEELQKTVKADFVVDATGKVSAFARSLNVCRKVFDEVTFLCTVVDIPAGEDNHQHTFVEAVDQGWWYAARLPNNKMIVTFCADKKNIKHYQWDKPRQWLALLKQTTWLRQNVPQTLFNIPIEALDISIQIEPSSLLSAVCGEGWLAVGDAASSYEPFTSGGMTKAVTHGEIAGSAIAKLLTQHRPDALLAYQKQVVDDFNQHVGTSNELNNNDNRFAEAKFWYKRLSG